MRKDYNKTVKIKPWHSNGEYVGDLHLNYQGKEIKLVSPKYGTSTTIYDDLGRIVKSVDFDNRVTTLEYKGNSKELLKLTRPNEEIVFA